MNELEMFMKIGKRQEAIKFKMSFGPSDSLSSGQVINHVWGRLHAAKHGSCETNPTGRAHC
jgi:hypothetical protein